MAGKITVSEALGDVLDWDTVFKLNALLDMQEDYESAHREYMMEPKE